MATAYGQLTRPQHESTKLDDIHYPINDTLTIKRTLPSHIPSLLDIFNDVVQEGRTYPHDELVHQDAFTAYFCAFDSFVVVDTLDTVLGGFYIKPNFPGRCSHVSYC
jgi:hypothetical protein